MSDSDLSTILSRLKRSGAMILVTGDVPTDVHARVSRTLLGDDDHPRRRVIVLQGTDPRVGLERLPEGAPTGADSLRVVPDGQPVRSTAAATSEPDGADGDGVEGNPGDTDPGSGPASDVPTMVPPDDSLAEVGATMAEAVAALERAAGGFDSAELRLCVGSLSQFVRADGSGDASTFFNLFGHLVSEKRALGHVHLPVGPTDPLLRRYGPLFDVIVELRIDGGHAQQRWSVLDGPTSEWLPV